MTMMPRYGLPGGSTPAHANREPVGSREGATCGCQIHPAWDGSGDYVVWIWYRAGGDTSWHVLSRHDGAPQRFLNPELAGVYARQCGFRPETVSVRWPPFETARARGGVSSITRRNG